jgi:hypothetical protein
MMFARIQAPECATRLRHVALTVHSIQKFCKPATVGAQTAQGCIIKLQFNTVLHVPVTADRCVRVADRLQKEVMHRSV